MASTQREENGSYDTRQSRKSAHTCRLPLRVLTQIKGEVRRAGNPYRNQLQRKDTQIGEAEQGQYPGRLASIDPVVDSGLWTASLSTSSKWVHLDSSQAGLARLPQNPPCIYHRCPA